MSIGYMTSESLMLLSDHNLRNVILAKLKHGPSYGHFLHIIGTNKYLLSFVELIKMMVGEQKMHFLNDPCVGDNTFLHLLSLCRNEDTEMKDKNLKLARLAISHGAIVDIKRKGDNSTPMLLACACGNIEFAKLLLQFGGKMTKRILYRAISEGQEGEIISLIKKHIVPDYQSNKADVVSPIPTAVDNFNGIERTQQDDVVRGQQRTLTKQQDKLTAQQRAMSGQQRKIAEQRKELVKQQDTINELKKKLVERQGEIDELSWKYTQQVMGIGQSNKIPVHQKEPTCGPEAVCKRSEDQFSDDIIDDEEQDEPLDDEFTMESSDDENDVEPEPHKKIAKQWVFEDDPSENKHDIVGDKIAKQRNELICARNESLSELRDELSKLHEKLSEQKNTISAQQDLISTQQDMICERQSVIDKQRNELICARNESSSELRDKLSKLHEKLSERQNTISAQQDMICERQGVIDKQRNEISSLKGKLESVNKASNTPPKCVNLDNIIKKYKYLLSEFPCDDPVLNELIDTFVNADSENDDLDGLIWKHTYLLGVLPSDHPGLKELIKRIIAV